MSAEPNAGRAAGSRLRLGAWALLSASLVAAALAAAALARCEVEPAHRLCFWLTWTALNLPLAALCAGLQAGALRGLLRADARAAALGWVAALAASEALLLWRYQLWLRPLGLVTLLTCCLGARLTATAALRPGGCGRPGRGLALLLATGLATGAFALWDPEARYAARYAENRPAARGEPGDAPAELSDLELADALAATWLDTHEPARLRWSWEEAVALEGILAHGRARGGEARARAEAFVATWADAQRERALHEPLWADACAPAIPLLSLSRPADAALIERVCDYVREGPRTSRGALSHLGRRAPPQAWVDTLFMHGVFLNRLGRAQPWALDEAERLGAAMLEHLQDASGLLRHAALELGPVTLRLPVEGCFWARGNAWVLYFLVDHALARRGREAAPAPALDAARERLLAAVLARQDASGLWPTDLGGAASAADPCETSASALFVAALRRGLEGGLFAAERVEPAIARGLRGLRARCAWRGAALVLSGTSTGTNPGLRVYYRAVATDENVGHGVGAALLALCPPTQESAQEPAQDAAEREAARRPARGRPERRTGARGG
ncbi:MAG: glycoside hydrolase family 88 protein [Planctomycetota bacterium]